MHLLEWQPGSQQCNNPGLCRQTFCLQNIEMAHPAHGAHEVLKATLSLVCGRQASACCHVLPAGSRQTGGIQQLIQDIDPDLEMMPGQVSEALLPLQGACLAPCSKRSPGQAQAARQPVTACTAHDFWYLHGHHVRCRLRPWQICQNTWLAHQKIRWVHSRWEMISRTWAVLPSSPGRKAGSTLAGMVTMTQASVTLCCTSWLHWTQGYLLP